MNMEFLSDDDLLRDLTYRIGDIYGRMLECPEIAQPPGRYCVQPRPSFAGAFDILPLELVHRIFEHLDLLTLQNVGYTSIRGRLLLESLPAYRELVTYAPRSLACLNRTGQIMLHSVM